MLTTYPDRTYTIEPANIAHVYCVTSINLANFPRQIALPPIGATNTELYREDIEYVDNFAVINTVGLTEEIQLKEGFNCTIQQYDKQFVIQGDIGAGANVLEDYTHEVPQDAEEEALLLDGKYLTGGITCASIIKHVNGIAQEHIPIISTGGIQVYSSDTQLRLTIQADPKNLTASCQLPE